MKVLTEADLRAAGVSSGTWHVSRDTFVTPTAREYLRDRGVALAFDSPASMSRTPAGVRGKGPYVDGTTGERLSEKPENMTHLHGSVLVDKAHPRIELRGGLDSLQAEILLLQAECRGPLREDLGDVLRFVRDILGAEVKEQPLRETRLLGMSLAEVRRQSHSVGEVFGMDHPIPDCSMGPAALRLNLLRTRARQVELSAVRAFPAGERTDIVRHLNRLSSGLYLLFCREVSGFYQRKGGQNNG